MTREEAIKVFKRNYPSSCYTMLREAVDIAIEALSQPSLPSNLDEAAEDYEKNKTHSISSLGIDKTGTAYYIRQGTSFSDAFKAGAEWMAGQGRTIESLVWRDEDDRLFIEAFIDENKFKMAENIIIQIRKKQ